MNTLWAGGAAYVDAAGAVAAVAAAAGANKIPKENGAGGLTGVAETDIYADADAVAAVVAKGTAGLPIAVNSGGTDLEAGSAGGSSVSLTTTGFLERISATVVQWSGYGGSSIVPASSAWATYPLVPKTGATSEESNSEWLSIYENSAVEGYVYFNGVGLGIMDGVRRSWVVVPIIFGENMLGDSWLRIGPGVITGPHGVSPDLNNYLFVTYEQNPAGGDTTGRLFTSNNDGTTGNTSNVDVQTPESGDFLMADGGKYVLVFERDPDGHGSGTDTAYVYIYDEDGTTLLASAESTSNLPGGLGTTTPSNIRARFMFAGLTSDAATREMWVQPGGFRTMEVAS